MTTGFVSHHPWGDLLAGWIVISNAITAMPQKWDGWYNWFYRFIHGVLQVVTHEANKKGLDLPEAPTIAPKG